MKKSLLLTLAVAGHLAYMVLVPLFVFGGSGLLLDDHFHTLPRFLLIGIVFSFIITIYWMSKRMQEIIKAMVAKE